jgi:GAF domain-containing protein
VPVYFNEEITVVLDIDSKDLGTFDETDASWLEKIAGLLH